jgi:tetratricopeptide (TPR) repeat protein
VGTAFPDGATLFAVTSDHGESFGEHGEVTHSMTIYDATQRVPLVVSGPGWPKGRVVSTPVGVVDLAPTFLAALGAPPLDDVDGRDLHPLATGEAGEPVDRALYVETLATQTDFGWSPLLGLRTQRYKYIRAPRPELYDVAADPEELSDLSEDPQYADVMARLDAELEERLARARPGSLRLEPGDETRAQLEALGYVVAREDVAPNELGVVGGTDPKDGLPQVTALLRAMILLAQGRPAAALGEIPEEEGSSYLLDLYRSMASLEAGDPQAAERYARSSVEHSPGSLDARIALGRALEGLGRWDAAAGVYEAARQIDASSADSDIGLGRVAEGRGDREAALALYARATAGRGASVEAVWREAALRIEAGEDAEPLLARISRRVLDQPAAALRLARAEVSAGEHDAARARLRRALAATPASKALREAFEALPPSSG